MATPKRRLCRSPIAALVAAPTGPVSIFKHVLTTHEHELTTSTS